MADPVWKMKGQWLKNCSCDFGCPCDFNARPTKTVCEGMLTMKIEEGYFKDVKLEGLVWAGTYLWPGPLHEGNGTFLPVVDEKATDCWRKSYRWDCGWDGSPASSSSPGACGWPAARPGNSAGNACRSGKNRT